MLESLVGSMLRGRLQYGIIILMVGILVRGWMLRLWMVLILVCRFLLMLL